MTKVTTPPPGHIFFICCGCASRLAICTADTIPFYSGPHPKGVKCPVCNTNNGLNPAQLYALEQVSK